MADLAALRELYAFVQDNPRILYAKCGELELRVSPVPPAPVLVADDSPSDDIDEERRDLEVLLHSSGADISPFMRRRQ